MRKTFLFFLLILLVASCRTFNPQEMFKTEKDFVFRKDSSTTKNKEYLLAADDQLEMHFYSIEGFKLVDVTSSTQGTGTESVHYVIEKDGLVKLPVIGKTYLLGMTLREAERFLEEKYSKYYISPFVMLRVTNRHAYVFFADNGRGQMVTIQNDNTTALEVLAIAGGITENSKAWRVKVIRGNLRNPQVYLIDLSTIEGLKSSDLTIQSNDIIYVESTPNYKQKLLAQLTPVVGIITSVLLIMNVLK